ncbi:UNVERIFIED_CONTAM: hypothetical protein PYX00_000685 [Menopon gallinae]|uniref:Spliceosome-associated protein CWC27 homolog n=1 Tax=Menopon gallinae TaxID=328185 RepID=A0AAW2IBB9_9NEOP
MSNIYIQEPPTLGKVLLITTVGEIDIELWAKETPKTCRNFIQLCMEGYYNGTIFHRVVKGFIAQGGDPTGTGSGGESIYGEPFKDEFHSRLRFTHRGLVAMANSGKDDNGSQFFFTFGPCPELQNKNTIFGKVAGDTIYNMLKLESGEIDSNERPVYPQKIIKVEILNNPFPDIVPRSLPKAKVKKKTTEEKKTGVKNFKLLSFGEEAEEDEEENKEISLTLAGKSKSTHDALDDPKLSSVPAVDVVDDDKQESEKDPEPSDLMKVKEKLKAISGQSKAAKRVKTEKDFASDDLKGKDAKKQKLEEIKKEILDLKKSYQRERRPEPKKEEVKEPDKKGLKVKGNNEYISEYNSNLDKYASKQKEIPLKGSSREDYTMSLLAKFQEKLASVKNAHQTDSDNEKDETDDNPDVDDETDDKWLAHKLVFEDNTPVLAKDANLKSDDWFDIMDPRNAINKRRREKSKISQKK